MRCLPLFSLLLLPSCAALMDKVGPDGSFWSILWGVAKATPDAAVTGITAMQAGGWAAGGLAAALALLKAGVIAWHKVGSVAENTVAAGVAKHAKKNGGRRK